MVAVEPPPPQEIWPVLPCCSRTTPVDVLRHTAAVYKDASQQGSSLSKNTLLGATGCFHKIEAKCSARAARTGHLSIHTLWLIDPIELSACTYNSCCSKTTVSWCVSQAGKLIIQFCSVPLLFLRKSHLHTVRTVWTSRKGPETLYLNEAEH